jgi:uncharacterized protein YndB with AHSA1/START domain
MYIRHANGVELSGEVLEVARPERIVFTYGYANGQPMGPGQSRVTIALREEQGGTRLELRHEFADAPERDLHIQGWRFQLSLFSNVVLNGLHTAAAEALVDAWHAVWGTTDEAARLAELQRITLPEVEFRDRYSTLRGHEDLQAHIGAALRFMPGVLLKRKGGVVHSQGYLLAAWAVAGPDGKEMMSGHNVYSLAAEGRIESVVGFAG